MKGKELYPFYIFKVLGLEIPFTFPDIGFRLCRIFHTKVKIKCCGQNLKDL